MPTNSENARFETAWNPFLMIDRLHRSSCPTRSKRQKIEVARLLSLVSTCWYVIVLKRHRRFKWLRSMIYHLSFLPFWNLKSHSIFLNPLNINRDGACTQIRRSEVLCRQCSNSPHHRAIPRLCLPLLNQDVQHNLHICLPSYWKEIRFPCSGHLPSADPALASLFNTCPWSWGCRPQTSAC